MPGTLLGFIFVAGFDMERDSALGSNGIDEGFVHAFLLKKRRNFPVEVDHEEKSAAYGSRKRVFAQLPTLPNLLLAPRSIAAFGEGLKPLGFIRSIF